MKLKVILFGVALILCGVIKAQVSKASFEKAVDLLNCKAVELALPKENITNYKSQCPCDKVDSAGLNKFLRSVNELDATIAFSKEVESLKNAFRVNWQKDDVVSFLSEGIFTDNKYKTIVEFAKKRNGKSDFEAFKAFKASLKSNLEATLEEDTQQLTSTSTNTSVEQSTFEDRIKELESNQNNKKTDNRILGGLADILIIFSTLMGIIAVILSVKKSKGDGREIPSEIKNYIRTKIDDAKMNRSPQNNISSSESKDTFKRITDLESEVRRLKDKIFTSNSVPNSAHQITPKPYQEIKQPDVRAEIFFLSTPNSDGSFDENSASSTYKEGTSIYCFTKTGNNKANFQIDEKEASIKLALQYRDRRIDPVCEATNAFNQAKHITTVRHGEAELQNGKWVVINKVKIRYE